MQTYVFVSVMLSFFAIVCVCVLIILLNVSLCEWNVCCFNMF